MSGSGGSRRWSVPRDAVVRRGAELDDRRHVVACVFHVETEDGRWIVHERRGGSGRGDLACTCPAGGGCEHVAAVLVHLARHGHGAEQLAILGEPGEVSRPSIAPDGGIVHSGYSLPPPAAIRLDDGAALVGNPERSRLVRSALLGVLAALPGRCDAEGRRALEEAIERLDESLFELAAPDLTRTLADLRCLATGEEPDAGRAALVIERVRGVLALLDDLDAGEEIDPRLASSYLGRDWDYEDAERREDCHLLEVARSTVLTPFGLRRNRAFFLDLGDGRLLVEQSLEQPGSATNPSVGPFPRKIHAGLMITMPGLAPTPLKLLQYVILPPASESDLLRIKKAGITSAARAHEQLLDTIRIARAPHPCFVVFSPARVLVQQGMAALSDGEGGILPLAHGVHPRRCQALAHLRRRVRIHCAIGMLVWTGRETALDPFSLLVADERGMSLVRLC